MDKLFVYGPKYQHLSHMSGAMLPPEPAYRFKPTCKEFSDVFIVTEDVFSGTDRLLFGGGVKYLKDEITALQKFFKHIKENTPKLTHDLFDIYFMFQIEIFRLHCGFCAP